MTLLEWSWAGYPGRFMTDHWTVWREDGRIELHVNSAFASMRASFSGSFVTLRDLARYLGQRPSQIHGEVQQP